MKKQLINYDTLLKVTKAITHSKNPEEIVLITVESVTTALDVKGCALFLINNKTSEAELAASYGLSDEYLKKGPVSSKATLAQIMQDGPVAIYDVLDDPRIQYPEAAKKEGIASILSTPIILREKLIGAFRVYTSEPWEFELDDVSFVQAMAQMAGLAIEMARQYKGLKDSIEILKTLRDPKILKQKKWTPFEGVPVSVPKP